jgi:L-aspartate oxidase
MGKEVSHSLRRAMTLNCGVQRNDKKLNTLINHINYLIEKVGPANPLVASKMIASCALAREECRGAHYRDDFNFTKKNAKSSYITYDMLD